MIAYILIQIYNRHNRLIRNLRMLLTDHVQAIIKSAKSIVVARNYPELAPEHLMLALMLDRNDLPQILLERIGIDNPEVVDRLNNYVSKRAYFARGKFSDVRLSTDTLVLMKVAQEEAEKHGDEQVSIEHLLLALFRIDNKTLNHLLPMKTAPLKTN